MTFVTKPPRRLINKRCTLCDCPILDIGDFLYCSGCVIDGMHDVKKKLKQLLDKREQEL